MTGRGALPIPRFIVGMPRSGTTWLCRSLNQHPDVAVFGESMFWGKAFVEPGASGHYGRPELDQLRTALAKKAFETTVGGPADGRMRRLRREDLPHLVRQTLQPLESSNPGAVFRSLADAIARAEGKSQWIEKTPHHLLHAERILTHLPDSRFVVTLRDPHGFMLSYKHQPGHERTVESRRRFERRYHPLGCALVWRNSLVSALRLSERHPECVMILRQDALRDRPDAVLRDVQRFFLLKEDPQVVPIESAVNSSFDQEQRPALTDPDIAWMNLVAGSQIRAGGFRPSTARRPWLALGRSSLELPFWALRIAADTRRTADTNPLRYLRRWIGAGNARE